MPTLKSNAIPEYVLHTPAHMVYQLHDISTLTSL